MLPKKYISMRNWPAHTGINDLLAACRAAKIDIDPSTVAATFAKNTLQSFTVPMSAAAWGDLDRWRGLFVRNVQVRCSEVDFHLYKVTFNASAVLRGPGVLLAWPVPKGGEQNYLGDIFAGFRLAGHLDRDGRVPWSLLPNNITPRGDAEPSGLCAVVRAHSHDEALVILRERDGKRARLPDGSVRACHLALSPLSLPAEQL